jgi:hypothetical protein
VNCDPCRPFVASHQRGPYRRHSGHAAGVASAPIRRSRPTAVIGASVRRFWPQLGHDRVAFAAAHDLTCYTQSVILSLSASR